MLFLYLARNELYIYQFDDINIVTEFPCLLELNMYYVTRYDSFCRIYKHINSKYFHRKKKYSRRKHVFRRNSLAEIHPKNGFPGPFSGRKNLGFPVIFMAESEIPMETLAEYHWIFQAAGPDNNSFVTKLSKCSRNIIDSNLKNYPKFLTCSKQDMHSKQWKVRDWKKESYKKWKLSINLGLMFEFLVSKYSLTLFE